MRYTFPLPSRDGILTAGLLHGLAKMTLSYWEFWENFIIICLQKSKFRWSEQEREVLIKEVNLMLNNYLIDVLVYDIYMVCMEVYQYEVDKTTIIVIH